MTEKERRSLVRRDPFGELELFADWGPLREFGFGATRLGRLARELFGEVPPKPGLLAPAVDIVENDEQYVLTAELPGMKRDDVTIELQDNVLSIRGEKHSEREGKKEHRRWVERSFGSFARSFTLPPNTAPDELKATFSDGVLTIEIPKMEESKPKIISIRS